MTTFVDGSEGLKSAIDIGGSDDGPRGRAHPRWRADPALVEPDLGEPRRERLVAGDRNEISNSAILTFLDRHRASRPRP